MVIFNLLNHFRVLYIIALLARIEKLTASSAWVILARTKTRAMARLSILLDSVVSDVERDEVEARLQVQPPLCLHVLAARP